VGAAEQALESLERSSDARRVDALRSSAKGRVGESRSRRVAVQFYATSAPARDRSSALGFWPGLFSRPRIRDVTTPIAATVAQVRKVVRNAKVS